MLAVILDIDATLVDSCASDAELYADAIRHVLGQVRIRDAWELYHRVTDTGILADVCRDNCLEYDEGLSLSVMDEFVARLSANMAVNGPYLEVPGALRFVQTAVQRPDVRVAYATGGWRASAKLKLLAPGSRSTASRWQAPMIITTESTSCCTHWVSLRVHLRPSRTLAMAYGTERRPLRWAGSLYLLDQSWAG